MTVAEPTVRPTRYEVSLLPQTDINYPSYVVTVEYRGAGRWAVTRHHHCLSVDGTWSWEALPSNRQDEWLAAHRFNQETALHLAREAVWHITVNGHTVHEALNHAAGEQH